MWSNLWLDPGATQESASADPRLRRPEVSPPGAMPDLELHHQAEINVAEPGLRLGGSRARKKINREDQLC
jgi:hypothetical protein